ncbi:MAG: glycosyltransferase family 4 protein [Acidimicrobiia bacterium]|nr:MAG: glycosyltransferase family 4 protein [Acidimicrobiia bacterium]
MRLLLITNDYPPKPGGIQQYLGNLVDAWPGPVHVIAPAAESPRDAGRVSRHEAAFMWPTGATGDWIIESAERFAPDVVLFGAPFPLPYIGPRLRDRLKVPYAVLAHGAEVTLPAAAPGFRQAIARALGGADLRFAASRYTADRVARLTGRDVVYIGAGVDVDVFIPAPDGRNEVPVVGCVSRFVPRKGQHRLLEAVARLHRPAEVLIVGKGRKEADLRRLADRLGVRARFIVDPPWSELPGLYRSMDVFCMPCRSRWGGLEVEGLGLVFLEAAASGLPVLVGDSGGSPETVLPGKSGFVVRSVDDIVQGLDILFGDPQAAQEMGAAGRRFVEDRFTWDRVVDRLTAGFEAVLS